MMITRPVLLALAATCAFSAPTLAQTMPSATSGMMMKEGVMTMVMPDGRMSTMTASDKAMADAMMKDGKLMTGTHMMMSGGRVYMMEDRKMSDGRMMSEHMTMNK